MGKILQVIKKDSDFENGKVKINLYDTSFKTLSKLMDSVPGQTVQNAATGQKVGYQVFRNLNSLQYAERVKLEKFTSQYNSWVNTTKSKVSNLINFNYIFTSLTQNYSNSIVKDSKVDMLLLEKIVNPEKELYDFTIKADDHMQSNLSKMREWSKKRSYGSCVNQYISKTFQIEARGVLIKTKTPGHGVSASLVEIGSSYNKNYHVILSNLDNIPVGSTITVHYRVERFGNHVGDINFSIKKNSLGANIDDGYLVLHNFSAGGNGVQRVYGSNYYTHKNIPSPHFNTSSVNLKFLKSRVLI